MNSQLIKTTRNLFAMILFMVFFVTLANEAQAQVKRSKAKSSKFSKNKKVTKKPTTKPVIAKPGQVLICASKSSKTFHKKKCAGMAKCKTKTTSLALAAARKTRKPCKICYPKGLK